MSLVNVISAVGNNNSRAPLLVRDCGIEIPTKVLLTYKQNVDDSPKVAKYAVRERLIDEYTSSAIWLGSVPAVEYVANKMISKKGFNPLVDPRLFKADTAENPVQGIDFNINKFKNASSKKVQDAIADLVNVKNNRQVFEGLMSKRFVAAVAIPIALMGFVLPKCIFALSKKIFEKENTDAKVKNDNNQYTDIFGKADITTFGQKKQVSFNGLASSVASLTIPDKMAAIDGGYAIGRIVTARPGYEPFDIAFKMAGMLYLNFVAPKQIAKLFDFISNKFLNCNVNLDPKLLNDEKFIDAIGRKEFDFLAKMDGKQMLDYIDNNPQSMFAKLAAKFKKITMLTENYRDPRLFVELDGNDGLEKFGKDVYEFAKQSIESNNFKKYAKKALGVKSFNIISNVALSSFLLAYALPKAQFALRELFTGSKLEPGLINVDNKKAPN